MFFVNFWELKKPARRPSGRIRRYGDGTETGRIGERIPGILESQNLFLIENRASLRSYLAQNLRFFIKRLKINLFLYKKNQQIGRIFSKG